MHTLYIGDLANHYKYPFELKKVVKKNLF